VPSALQKGQVFYPRVYVTHTIQITLTSLVFLECVDYGRRQKNTRSPLRVLCTLETSPARKWRLPE